MSASRPERHGSFLCPVAVLLLVALLGACDGTSAPEHLTSARGYFDQGDFKTAVVELKNALQKDPDLGEARLLLARSHEIQGQYADALREYERALNAGVDSSLLEAGMLSAKIRVGRYQEVIGALAAREPLPADLAVVLADAYLAGEDLQAAQSLYELAARSNASVRGLATIAWVRGDVSRARTLFDEAVALDPRDRESWIRRGELALSEQRFSDASASFEKAKLLPGGAASGGLGLARTYLAEARLDEALVEVAAVLQAAPGLYLAHYVEALIRYGLDDVDGAETALRQVQRVVPDHTPSLFLMGAVKFRQGQLNQAEGSLLRYLSRDRENESAAKLLAVIRAQKEDLNGTIEVLSPFAETSEDPQLLAMLGTAELRQGRISEATRSLERAVALAPDAAAFRNQLALSLLSSGEEERAVVELESAISVDGSQFQSDYLFAMLSLKKREFATAEQAAQRMIEKSPDLPMGYNLRGAAALGQGNESQARSAFEQALRVAPDFLPAAQNLARLDDAAGDPGAAMDRYRGVIAATEDNLGARLALADLAARQGDSALAGEQLEAVLRQAPDSLPARMGLTRLALRDGRLDDAAEQASAALRIAPDSIDVLLVNSQIALSRGDRAAARRHAQALGRAARQSLLPLDMGLAIARVQRESGLADAARETLQRSEQSTPGDDEAALIAERLRLDLHDRSPRSARAQLDQLIATDPDRQDLLLLEGEVLVLEGREDEALALFESLAEAGDRAAVLRLAGLRQGRGQNAEALRLLDGWLAANPADTGAQLLRANVLMHADREHAIAQYEALASAAGSSATSPLVLNNLAWL